ncbi:MAG: SH3 domain-containing protein [Peptococcaceae bacterium]|jgi:hypothetical protein|nr:SH3 domain-containing protein [Peptococcaceae bacterium]
MVRFGKKTALWLLILGFMALAAGGCADPSSSTAGGQGEADALASEELSGAAEGLLGGYWVLVTEKNVVCSYQFDKDGSVSYREGLMQTDAINHYRGTYTTENGRVLLVFNEFPTQEIAPVSQMLEIEKIDEHSRQFTLNAVAALPDSRQKIGEPLVYSMPAESWDELWNRFALVQSEWGLHQRLGPDSGQESLQIIANQSWVIILDDTATDWAYVNYDGKLGWVSGKYLTDGYAGSINQI